MTAQLPLIVLTTGEPAGIGPDICCALAAESVPGRLAILADPELMRARADALGLSLDLVVHGSARDIDAHLPGRACILPVSAAEPVIPGRLNAANASYVLAQLEQATGLCLEREADALVTSPVNKAIVNEAGVPFTGHTEYLAELTGASTPVMMLARSGLRVALVTTHLPLHRVPSAITAERLAAVLRVADADLRSKFDIDPVRVLVLGLNPHAGEDGNLGVEEREVIGPVLDELRSEGLTLIGPVAADTAFTDDSLARCDLVLAMYHDQGLTPLKAGGFGDIVNVTLGLPIVRTSVDHGTALALAGSGRARHTSLRAAVMMAIELASRCRYGTAAA